MSTTPSDEATPRRSENWAPHRDTFDTPASTNQVPVRGLATRRIAGPVQGFGRLWQKTFRVTLGTELAPEEVIAHWRDHFGEFLPSDNRFVAPLAGVRPGEVGLIRGSVGGLMLSTGVLVLHSDDLSFTLLTPEGHPFAGLITFSAARDGDVTVAQVQLLIRSQDPRTEIGMVFGGHRKEDRMWVHGLRQLAGSLGLEAEPTADVVCVDRRRQWRRAGNVGHDVVLRAPRHPQGGRDQRP